MLLQNLISAQGPLPVSDSFTPIEDGSVVFVVTATAWSSTAPNQIGVEVVLNGTVIGTNTIFANDSQVHLALPTLFLNATITSMQPQKISLVALPNSVTDYNDTFAAQLMA